MAVQVSYLTARSVGRKVGRWLTVPREGEIATPTRQEHSRSSLRCAARHDSQYSSRHVSMILFEVVDQHARRKRQRVEIARDYQERPQRPWFIKLDYAKRRRMHIRCHASLGQHTDAETRADHVAHALEACHLYAYA